LGVHGALGCLEVKITLPGARRCRPVRTAVSIVERATPCRRIEHPPGPIDDELVLDVNAQVPQTEWIARFERKQLVDALLTRLRRELAELRKMQGAATSGARHFDFPANADRFSERPLELEAKALGLATLIEHHRDLLALLDLTAIEDP